MAKKNSVLFGITKKIKTGCGQAYITVNYEDGEPIQAFMNLGKAGSCTKAMCEALGKLVTVSLESEDADLLKICKILKGIQCPNPIWEEGKQNTSCIDALGKALEIAAQEKIKTKIIKATSSTKSVEEKKEKKEKKKDK